MRDVRRCNQGRSLALRPEKALILRHQPQLDGAIGQGAGLAAQSAAARAIPFAQARRIRTQFFDFTFKEIEAAITA